MAAPQITPEYRAAVMAELVEIGLVMARAARTEVETAETPQDRARAMAGYPRIARAIRQTLAFEEQLAQAVARAAEQARAAEAEARDQRRTAVMRRVREHVEATIYDRFDDGASGDDEDLVDGWLCGLRDWLHDDVLDPAVLDLPFEDIVARIEADLGLHEQPEPEPARRKPAPPRRRIAPAKAKPAKAKPAKAEPSKAEPSKAELAKAAPPSPAPATTAAVSPPAPPPVAVRPPPDPSPSVGAAPAAPIDVAPPRPPPDPPSEPYVPPWEHLRPGQAFPGGSGY